jgi:hypothetical protein
MIDSLHLKPLVGVDPNPANIVAAGTFNCTSSGGTLVMLRLETIPAQQMCRLTMRSGVPPVMQAMGSALVANISAPAQ